MLWYLYLKVHFSEYRLKQNLYHSFIDVYVNDFFHILVGINKQKNI